MTSRHYLTSELQKLPDTAPVTDYVKAMRISCRKFLNTVQSKEYWDIPHVAGDSRHSASWIFFPALGEMRGAIGFMLAQLVAAYGLNIEGDLEAILPGDDNEPKSTKPLSRKKAPGAKPRP